MRIRAQNQVKKPVENNALRQIHKGSIKPPSAYQIWLIARLRDLLGPDAESIKHLASDVHIPKPFPGTPSRTATMAQARRITNSPKTIPRAAGFSHLTPGPDQ